MKLRLICEEINKRELEGVRNARNLSELTAAMRWAEIHRKHPWRGFFLDLLGDLAMAGAALSRAPMRPLLIPIFLLATAATAQSPAPTVSDKTALAIRNEQLSLTRMSAEYQSLQRRIQEIETQFPESQKKLDAAIEEAYKGVDKKLWVLDAEAMVFKAVPVQKYGTVP